MTDASISTDTLSVMHIGSWCRGRNGLTAGWDLSENRRGSPRALGNSYESEARLQEWLDDHPKLLAGERINPADPCRWLLIRREARTPDHETGADAVDYWPIH